MFEYNCSRRQFLGLAGGVAAVAGLGLAGCGNSAAPAEGSADAASTLAGEVTYDGASSFQALVEAAAEKFMDQNPDVSVSGSGNGSGTGLTAVAAGTVTIGNSDVFAEEKLEAADAEKLVDHEVAVVGMGPVVSKNVTVDDLTLEQLKGIFSGAITNWSEVGGEDLPIQLVNRDEASGTREAFKSIIMDGAPFDRRAAVLSGTGQVRDVVSRTRGAIGYISMGFVESKYAQTQVRAISVNHVEPSEKTVASGGYPISRDLYFFTKGEPSDEAQGYIEYVLSDEMDDQIREAGFIPVSNDAGEGM